IVGALGVLAWQQVQVWHDSARLWSYTISIEPDSAVAHGKLGDELAIQGKLAEAIDHYHEALRLKPDDAEAETNLGAVLVQQGRPAEEIEHFQYAVRLQPESAVARSNLSVALAEQRKRIDPR